MPFFRKKVISIRFFNDTEVRAVWDEDNSKWWFSVLDIIGVLNESLFVQWFNTRRSSAMLLASGLLIAYFSSYSYKSPVDCPNRIAYPQA